MKIFNDNQINDGHLHAWCLYESISWRHFLYLGISIVAGKFVSSKSLTTHLPLELQHSIYTNKKLANKLLEFGTRLASVFKVRLYWENSPLLNYGSWDLKHGQTEWELIPRDVPLCLDTGHLILGVSSTEEAQKKILEIFEKYINQIGHLHIHENDLVHDSHNSPDKIITKKLLEEITKDKTYIFEK
jgi:sugar phosphate isomerase/epimerase